MKVTPDSDKICITLATLDDLDELQDIENKAFLCPWSRKAFEAELHGNEFSRIFVARRGEVANPLQQSRTGMVQRMVGYICVWMVFEELRFMNIAVEADMRRQGIGSELLKKSIKMGIEQGAQRALLEVRESNHAAQALYMQFGFESYGKRRKYYTNPDEDAMLMALEPVSISIS